MKNGEVAMDRDMSLHKTDGVPFGDFGATYVVGETVQPTDQEKSVGSYNWKETFRFSPYCGQFVDGAENAILAFRSTFSNFQRKPILDPVSGLRFPSGEHMYHFYKIPPEDREDRQKILGQPFPIDALKSIRSITKRAFAQEKVRQLWDQANLELMTFIQLVKAKETDTRFAEALKCSGNDFIIEDSSSRHGSAIPDRNWGDNGDGTGLNKLGSAQMKARRFFAKANWQPQEKSIVDYYRSHVEPDLTKYYEAYRDGSIS